MLGINHIPHPGTSIEESDPINIEEYKLDETVKLIYYAGNALKCTIMTRTKALLIYHHFRACVLETKYDPHTIAAACLNLSCKYNEENITLECIVHLFLCVKGKKLGTESLVFQLTQKNICSVEVLILRMLEFDLTHIIAHQYLLYFMNDLQEEISTLNVWDVFADKCSRLASDFYLSNKCLIYKADEIAIAVIKATLYMIGVWNDHYKLRLKIFNRCPESKIHCIIHDIFTICMLGVEAESGETRLQSLFVDLKIL